MKVYMFCLGTLMVISSSIFAMIETQKKDAPHALTEEEKSTLNRQLISASKLGDAGSIKELLKKGASFLVFDEFGYSPFNLAAIHGHVSCLNLFLDEIDEFPHKDFEHHWVLLAETKKFRDLLVPLFQRDVRSIEQLSQCIKKIELFDDTQIEESNIEKIDTEWLFLKRHISPGSPLSARALERMKVELSLIIVFSCFPTNDISLTLALETAGAQKATDSHAVPQSENMQTHLDRLLLFACKEGSKEFVEALIRAGASSNTSNSIGDTALHLAASRRGKAASIVQLLLTAGADVATTNRRGETPLHTAYELDSVKLLLEAGAPIECENNVSMRPFHSACSKGSCGKGQLLLEAGAKICPMTLLEIVQPHELSGMKKNKHNYFKMLLRSSARRYKPTQEQAKYALQNVANIFYVLGIRVGLPPYVVGQILSLLINQEEVTVQGQNSEPLNIKSLKKDLVTIYLYIYNGNDLHPLLRESLLNEGSDVPEVCRKLVVRKFADFYAPFLGDETIENVCISLMQSAAHEGPWTLKDGSQYTYYNAILGPDRELYYNHLRASFKRNVL